MRQPRHQIGPNGLDRALFFNRQGVLPADLTQDQLYFLDKYRRHHRLLHGWGIVLGLTVDRIPQPGTKDNDPQTTVYQQFAKNVGGIPPDADPKQNTGKRAWIVIEPGYAITPLGDEIYVPHYVFVDTSREWTDGTLITAPADCMASVSPKRVPRDSATWYLVVEAWEDQTGAVRAATSQCGDNPNDFQFSRLQDTVAFRLIRHAHPKYPFPNDIARLTGKPKRNWICLGSIPFQGDEPQPSTQDSRDYWTSTAPIPGSTASTGMTDSGPTASPPPTPVAPYRKTSSLDISLVSLDVVPRAWHDLLKDLRVHDVATKPFEQFKDALVNLRSELGQQEQTMRRIWEKAKQIHDLLPPRA